MPVVAVLSEPLLRERDRFLDFLSRSEGRDKFGKVAQFFARFLAAVAFEREWDVSRLDAFWKAMLDARRMHWFGKSMMELRTVQQTLGTVTLPTSIRENLMILTKIGAVKHGQDWRGLAVRCARFWGVALAFGILTELCKLQRVWKTSGISSDESAHLSAVQRKSIRRQCLRTILCHLGDLGIPLTRGFGVPLRERELALMHFSAAIIQSWNLYPTRQSRMSHTQRKRASLATFGEVYASYGQGGNRFSYMNFAPQTRADPKTIHSRTVCLRPPTALTQSPSLSGSGPREGGGLRQNEFSSTRTRASSRDGSVRGPSPEPGQNKHCRPDAMFDQSPVRGPGMKREAKAHHPAASPAATTANALPPVAVSKGKERATKRAAFLRLHDFLLKTHLGSVLTALKSDGYLDAGEVEKLGRKLEAVAGSVADSGASLYNSADLGQAATGVGGAAVTGSPAGGSAPAPTFRRVPTTLPRMDPPEKLFRDRARLPGELAMVEGGLRRQQPWEKDGRWQKHKTEKQGDTGQLFRKVFRKGYMAKITVRHKNGKISKRFPSWVLVKDPSKDWGCVVAVLLMCTIAVHGVTQLSWGENYWSRRRKAIRERIRLEYDLPTGWDNDVEQLDEWDIFHRGWEEDEQFRLPESVRTATDTVRKFVRSSGGDGDLGESSGQGVEGNLRRRQRMADNVIISPPE
eukprot:g17560.t1